MCGSVEHEVASVTSFDWEEVVACFVHSRHKNLNLHTQCLKDLTDIVQRIPYSTLLYVLPVSARSVLPSDKE